MLRESSSPPTDQPRRGVKPGSDLGVRHALSGIEHDPSPLHILKRKLLRPCNPLKLPALGIAEFDPVTRQARHPPHIQHTHPDPSTEIPTDTSGRVY